MNIANSPQMVKALVVNHLPLYNALFAGNIAIRLLPLQYFRVSGGVVAGTEG